jgi:hypothetical protein
MRFSLNVVIFRKNIFHSYNKKRKRERDTHKAQHSSHIIALYPYSLSLDSSSCCAFFVVSLQVLVVKKVTFFTFFFQLG